MSDQIETLGQPANAGLARNVVDHGVVDHGDAVDAGGHDRCANCGTVLHGAYCHACGQAGHVHRTVGHIVEEFLHGIYHFDGKAWRTLPALVFHPGRLTRDYVYGHRARYIAPLALFLLTIFLMFFVFGMVGGPDLDKALNSGSHSSRRDAGIAAVPGRDADRQRSPAAQTKAVEPPWQGDLKNAVTSGRLKIDLGNATIDERVREAALDPQFAFYRIEQKAYKLSFLLIPLSLPTLWLLFFRRRDITLYDHTVFALYSLSFMSLLLVADVLLNVAGHYASWLGSITGLFLLIPPIHMYAQLKGAYALSVGGALWRTAVLCLASIATLGIFAVLIVVLGLAD